MVASSEALTPVPAIGVAVDRSGGHAVAQAPVQALVVRESALNRYRVRPWESTRICPSLPLCATLTVTGGGLGGGAVDVGGGDAAVAPPPPQAATARAVSGIAAALARKVMGLLRVMSLLRLGRSTVAATSGYRIRQRVVRNRKTS